MVSTDYCTRQHPASAGTSCSVAVAMIAGCRHQLQAPAAGTGCRNSADAFWPKTLVTHRRIAAEQRPSPKPSPNRQMAIARACVSPDAFSVFQAPVDPTGPQQASARARGPKRGLAGSGPVVAGLRAIELPLSPKGSTRYCRDGAEDSHFGRCTSS